MSGMMLHGLGDCTPELNCGCMAKSPRDANSATRRSGEAGMNAERELFMSIARGIVGGAAAERAVAEVDRRAQEMPISWGRAAYLVLGEISEGTYWP